MSDRRYPFQALVDVMGCAPSTALRRLGVSGREGATYLERGVTLRVADRLAIRAGFDLYAIWPEALNDAIADVERECAADDCTEVFVPPARVPHKKFCSKTCKSRDQRRRRYREDVAYRDRVKASMRRYYEETRDYQLRRGQWYRDQAKRRVA